MNTIKKFSLSALLISGIATNCSGAQFARKLWQKTPVALLTGAAMTCKELKETKDALAERACDDETLSYKEEMPKNLPLQKIEKLQRHAFREKGIKNLVIFPVATGYDGAICTFKNPTMLLSWKNIFLLTYAHEEFCELYKKIDPADLFDFFGSEHKKFFKHKNFYNEEKCKAEFVLGHELTHLKHKDGIETQYIKPFSSLTAGAVWFTARMAGYGRILSGFAALIGSETPSWAENKYGKYIEKRADLEASTNPEVLRAGAKCFIDVLKEQEKSYKQLKSDLDIKKHVKGFPERFKFFSSIFFCLNNSFQHKIVLTSGFLQEEYEGIKQLLAASFLSYNQYIYFYDEHPYGPERARYLNELADKLEKEQKEASE